MDKWSRWSFRELGFVVTGHISHFSTGFGAVVTTQTEHLALDHRWSDAWQHNSPSVPRQQISALPPNHFIPLGLIAGS